MAAVPIVIYWALAIWGMVSTRPVLIYLFFGSLPFAAFAVVPPTLTAGLTFLPSTMTMMLLILRTLANEHRALVALGAALNPRRLGVLTAFFVTAIVTTLFMPRLFAGTVMVIPMRGSENGAAALGPSMQNVSQLAYLSISILGVFAFSQILKTPDSRQVALHAIFLAAAVTIATGFLDLATQFLPISPLLEPFRTATYNLLVDVEVAGAKRVVGLTPEASSFGSLCLAMLCFVYFLRRGVRNSRVRDVYTPPLILGTLVFAWLSTSSATYVGLGLFLVIATAEWMLRFFERRYSSLRRRHLGLEFAVAAFGTFGVVALILFNPAILDSFRRTLDTIVFTKAQSSSFEERSLWTAVSLKAFIDSYGFGVGLGATRASNSIVAVLSNVGIVGAVLYFGFIIQSLLRKASRTDQEGQVIISALRYAFFPPFIVGLLAGTTADFGAIGAFRYGTLTAIGLGSVFAARQGRPAVSLARLQVTG